MPESPLDSKNIKQVNFKGNQSWNLFERIHAETEVPIIWSLDMKSWLIGKVPDAGKNWRQKKGEAEHAITIYYKYSMRINLSKFQEPVKNRAAWSALVHGVTKCWTWLSNRTHTHTHKHTHTYNIMSSVNYWVLFIFFPIWIPFIYFSSLIAMTRTFRSISNNSSKCGHHCLISYLRRNAFYFSTLKILFVVGLSCWPLLCWSKFLLCLLFGYFKIIDERKILSKAFSASIETIIFFPTLSFLIWLIYVYWTVLAPLG